MSQILFPVFFSHDNEPLGGITSNMSAAYRIVERKNKELRDANGKEKPLSIRYDQMIRELKSEKRMCIIPLADNSVATIRAVEKTK